MEKHFLTRCRILVLSVLFFIGNANAADSSWIRINQLGYSTHSHKVAVWCSKNKQTLQSFELIDADSRKCVYRNNAGKAFGKYGPFSETYRLDFTAFIRPGKYYLKTGNTVSTVFAISDTVYKGAADFCLRYMRQQRSGFNPFLNDSCHTHDGYTLYGPMPDSTHIDAIGGWHDASDYLQYSTTSANATYHLLAAYRDYSHVFTDRKKANGLDGKNGIPDILDEARWGLNWLLKMNPQDDWMFNQLGDDRDHMGMRIPKEDAFYGKGFERPVYFVSGERQQRGKFLNNTTGTSSIAGKFASAFSLGSQMYAETEPVFASLLQRKANSAWLFGLKKPGVSQTASVRSPYIYAEDNWVDDMELAGASLFQLSQYKDSSKLQAAFQYAKQEPVTPWLGNDTAKHYQWYPFINLGHYELALTLQGAKKDTILDYYRQGIEKVWSKAKKNAFYRGIPFIWCSNNLTTSFAIQCSWYERLTQDHAFAEFEQANFDWLFGCNPWGTSMVYGLPSWGDTPEDPHSAFTHIKHYPIDGGLVDGPVYTSIYKGLIGIQLKDADEYAEFQSDLAVYHDDYGDYSTNEPTMDGTASLIYLLAAKETASFDYLPENKNWRGFRPKSYLFQFSHKAAIRGDSTKKQIALVFTGDEFGDGLNTIAHTLEKQQVKGSFFFTGRFYRNKAFQEGITKLYLQKNMMGPHSDEHLLYCDWTKRDSTLVTKDSLLSDLFRNEDAMIAAGIKDEDIGKLFIPPYEWWNDKVASWLDTANSKLFCFTPGTTSNADYTFPEMGKSYRSSELIMQSIKKMNDTRPQKLNGVILLVHAGTDPRRTDKLYNRLDELISYLKKEGYQFKRVDELLAD